MTKVVFSTNCYYKDFHIVNRDLEYRAALCNYPFDEIWVTINNVPDIEKVKKMFEGRARVIVAEEVFSEACKFFNLTLDDFKDKYADGTIYSIASLVDLYLAKDFDYICHFCSDSELFKGGDWVTPAIKAIESGEFVVARPMYPRYELQVVDNGERKTQVFSDHAYVIPVKKFRCPEPYKFKEPKIEDIHPIYGGDSFERKMTRYMHATNTWEKIIPITEEYHPCYTPEDWMSWEDACKYQF